MIVHLFNSSLVSGPETLVLPALANSNLTVEVWFLQEARLKIDDFRNPVLYAESLGLKVRIILVKSRWDSRAIEALVQLIVAVQPQIIHAHEVKASVYLGMASFYQKILKCLNLLKFNKDSQSNILLNFVPSKIVTTHHGVHARSRFLNRLYERVYCFFGALLFDRIYTVCSSDVQLLKKIWYMPVHKVQLQLNGVTRQLITSEKKSELRQKYLKEWSILSGEALVESHIYLGLVARLSPEKNHLRIFVLFKKLLIRLIKSKQKSQVFLLVFGLGPLEKKLKSEVERMVLKESILFLGYHQNMAQKIAAFDLLISLSKGEGLPINLIEAGWAGTAVVANAIDGNCDLLTQPEQGILIQANQTDDDILKKIESVINFKGGIANMGQSFQKHVQANFSEENWICRLKQSYQELGLSLEDIQT